MNWPEVLQIGGLAGIVSALFGFIFKEGSAWLDRKRNAKFLALKICIEFEEYFKRCFSQIEDINDYISSSGHAGAMVSTIPEFLIPTIENNIGLSFNSNILDDILGFPGMIKYENERIEWILFHDFDPDGPDPHETLPALYKISFFALDIAKLTRKKYHLRSPERIKKIEDNAREKFQEYLEKTKSNKSL